MFFLLDLVRASKCLIRTADLGDVLMHPVHDRRDIVLAHLGTAEVRELRVCPHHDVLPELQKRHDLAQPQFLVLLVLVAVLSHDRLVHLEFLLAAVC